MPELSKSILAFFLERMSSHSKVDRLEEYSSKDDKDECLFKIYRKDGLSLVIVHLSDAYDYGSGEYLARPRRVDFILIARPEAKFDESLITRAKADRIGIGRLARLMGAINVSEPWRYQSPEEKKRNH